MIGKSLAQGFRQLQVYSTLRRVYSRLYEPDYLDALKPKIPTYDTVDVKVKGYDFRILENYQRYINRLAVNLDIAVDECWAIPPQQIHVQKFKDQTNIIESEYKLQIYERTVQITDVPSTKYPILLRALENSLPEGVSLQVHEHMPDHEEVRYVPDQELKQLKTQLDEIGSVKKTK